MPQRLLLLEGQFCERSPGERLHRPEAPLELVVGRAQRLLGAKAIRAHQIDRREQQISGFFQSRIAEEAGQFAFDDVARSISDKLEARHPHIFAGASPPGEARDERWEALKAAERAHKGATSALDGVAMALPALMRSEKLQKRAAREGFDWPDTSGPADKLAEETRELAEASPDKRLEEAGDLLFAAVNLVRAYGLGAEEALRAANDKFERRFRAMEALAGGSFGELSLEQQEALWQQVKRQEGAQPAA